MDNKQNIVSIFFQKFYPTAYAVLLSGSYVDQQEHSMSDVDVIIFVTEYDKCFNEDFNYGGVKIQAIVIATQLLPALLQKDYALGTGNQIGMIAKGTVVHETDGYLTNLVTYCKELYKSGPPKKSAEQLRLLKLDIIQLYQKLHSNQFEENFFQVTDLSTKLALYNLYYHRWWASNRKFLFEQLKMLNPRLQKELFSATISFFKTKNTGSLIKFTKENLLSLGNLEDLNSVNTGFATIKENELLMSINIKKNEYFFIHNDLKDFIFEIAKIYKIQYYFYRTYSSEHQLQEFDSIIVVLKSDNSILNQLLIDFNRSIMSPKKSSIKNIRYPVNIDIVLGFEKNKYMLIEPLFFKLCEFILNKKYTLTETERILFSIDIIHTIGKLTFKDLQHFFIFLRYVYTCWIPKSYDTGQIYGFHQILNAKNRVEEIFKRNSALHVQSLTSVFQNAHNWDEHSYVILPEDLYAVTKSSLQKIEQVSDCTYNSFELHPVFEFLPQRVNISNYVFLKNTLERILGILSIEEPNKAYIVHLTIEMLDMSSKAR